MRVRVWVRLGVGVRVRVWVRARSSRVRVSACFECSVGTVSKRRANAHTIDGIHGIPSHTQHTTHN